LRRVLVVGGSLAGLRAAQALRRGGYEGDIDVVDPDPDEPYDRPPLSKGYLTGDDASDAVRPPVNGLAELDLSWQRGRTAVSLDVAGLTVGLDDGSAVSADGIVIACGASPRELPGSDGIEGVHVLRSLGQARSLRSELDSGPRRVAVIGGGFIGAEVAASARARGHDVTIVEALDLPLARVLPESLAARCAELHRAHGVDLQLGVGVDRVTTDHSGRVDGVQLLDGSEVAADVVVVGIGVVPNTSWLDDSDLELADGVVCDDALFAAPDIVAAGDVARWPSRRFGEAIRVEHWENAVDMGTHAGRNLLVSSHGEGTEPYDPIPWFWSDQYDRKIQLAGRCASTDLVHVVEDDAETGRFLALIGRGDELVGVFGINRPAPVQRWRIRIADRTSWSDALTDLD
jgi:3-phenylpropionate/trans-cinnamate dioxygenase ferredoxin reductase component